MMHVISRFRHSARWMAGCLILLGLLLAVSGVIEHHAAASEQQIITYRASAENFPNPERGVYIQRSPIWRNGERIPLTRSDLLRARSQRMAMMRTYYLLEPYRNQPLPQSVIDYLQADFATAREAGVKIVLRFAYNFGIGEPDAPLERVLQHIDQVTPVIRSNTDVIAFKAQPYIGCANALNELIMMRWSTINSGYHPGVLQRWRDEGCYDDIARRLGYRFRLIDAAVPRTAMSGSPFSITVRMTNDGFARPYNLRGLELVLRHAVNSAVTRMPLGSGDIRLFLPGPGETKTLTLTARLPARLATGDYEVLLNLPDPAPTLNTRPEYSIRLANEGVWEPSTGYNRLLATVTVSNGVFLPVIVK